MSEKKKNKAAEEQAAAEQQVKEKETEQAAQEPAQEDELEKLKKENAELQEKLLRQMAEFDNYRKRTTREKMELYTDATVKCVSEIVSVVDNFERALASSCRCLPKWVWKRSMRWANRLIPNCTTQSAVWMMTTLVKTPSARCTRRALNCMIKSFGTRW